MSETTAPEKPVEKKSRKKLIIIVVVVLALAGGGGVFYVKRAGAAPEGAAKGKKKSDHEAKSGKADEESEETATSDDEEKSGEEEQSDKGHEEGKSEKSEKKSSRAVKLSLPDDGEVKKVIELQPFIVNLADTSEARYLRLTVSIGIGEGAGGDEKPDPLFTTRIRNVMLAVLTTKSSEEVLTPEGKITLRKELLKAARAVSKEPKVEAIYITDFIVQL